MIWGILAVSALWIAALGVAWRLAWPLVDRHLTLAEAEEARRQAAWEEERAAVTARRILESREHTTAERLSTPLPEDIVAVLNEESEPWCRNELEQDYRQRYVKLGDWNAVRGSIGIGTIDG